MTRSVIRRVHWTLAPDVAPDADPPAVRMVCAVCGAKSPSGPDRPAASHWALTHAGQNPSHRTYREYLEMPYTAIPQDPDVA